MKLSMMQNPALGDEYTAQDLVEPGSGATERAVPAYSPYVIGVTGHRNLAEADLARVRGALVSFFDTIRQLLPDTELNVMLGMAAGGDLVVAETALALGISVQAVLPMPLAEFVVDFDDRNQRLLLELLAHRDLQYIELPLAARGASTRSTDALAGREAAYRNLTEVLNRKSNLMLALWDGKPSRRPGGTTDTVLRCLGVITDEKAPRLQFTVADPEADTDSPFVYWMPIAPGGNDEAVAATSPCFLTALGDTILQFGSQPPEALQRRLAEFNDYNRDFRRVSADVRTAPSDSLLARVPTDLLGEDRPRLAQLNAEYGKADTLALHYQKRSDSLFGIFGTFAFVMGCIYLVYDKLGENQGVLLTYLTILLGSVVLYRLLYTKVWFVKHLQYRALAETLRVSFYLCLAGVGRSVDAAEVLALSGIEGFEGFGWISDVLKNVAPMSSAPAPLLDPRLTEYVRTAWVDDQHRYFTRKVKQLEHKSKRVSRWQLAALVVTVVVLIIRLLFSHSLRTVYVTPGVPLKNLLMLVASVTALFLGAWKLHQSKMASRELIWQYKNQLAHFSRSSAELERTASPARQAEVLVELGKRSLMESYLWTIHRYHREHAPPAGA
jgi:hypothetical protein